MAKEEILAMETGPELNKLVAEQILGKKVVIVKYLSGYSFVKEEDLPSSENYEECYATVFGDGQTTLYADYIPGFVVRLDLLEDYSRDLYAADQVLNKLREEWVFIDLIWDAGAWDIHLENYFSHRKFYLGKESGATYEQLPEAICKVALIAKTQTEDKGG